MGNGFYCQFLICLPISNYTAEKQNSLNGNDVDLQLLTNKIISLL